MGYSCTQDADSMLGVMLLLLNPTRLEYYRAQLAERYSQPARVEVLILDETAVKGRDSRYTLEGCAGVGFASDCDFG
jgi:hypothetical protein